MNRKWTKVVVWAFLCAMFAPGVCLRAEAAEVIDAVTFGKVNNDGMGKHGFTGVKPSVGIYDKSVAVQGQGCVGWQMQTAEAGKYMLEIVVQAGLARRGVVSYQQGKTWIELPEMAATEKSLRKTFTFDVSIPAGQTRTAFRLTSTGKGIMYLYGTKLLRYKQAAPQDRQANAQIRASAEAATVTTEDGLTISLNAEGKIRQVAIAGKDCTDYQALYASGLTVLDVSDQEKVCRQVCTVEAGQGGQIVQNVEMPDDGLKAKLWYESKGDYLHVRGRIESLQDKDRGVIIQYGLPLDAIGWTWEPTLEKHEKVEKGRQYENSHIFMSVAGLEDGVKMEAERTIRPTKLAYTFCSSLYGPEKGLSFGHSRGEFRIFNVSHDAEQGVYRIEYAMGLSPDTKQPNQATFSFILYPTNSQWGYRAALEKYYRIFPQFFEKRVKQEGAVSPFWNPLVLKDCDEFAHVFCWSPRAGAPLLEMGRYTFTYYSPAHLGYTVKGYDPKDGKLPPMEKRLEALDSYYRRYKGYTPNALPDSIPFTQSGEYTVPGWSGVMSLEPELAFGKFLLTMMKKRVSGSSGVAYDGLTGGMNYRREHFKYADHPLLYDPVVKSCAVYNLFSCLEFIQEMRKEFDTLGGKLAIVNLIPQLVLYGDAFLDITTEECGIDPTLIHLGRRRETMYQKPATLAAKQLYELHSREDMERSMRKCLYYGIFPGCFGGMPGIRHSFSNYWEHPEWYNRDRSAWRKYMPLIQDIAHAGWEPVPYARADQGQIGIQRFGRFDKKMVYFTVCNKERLSAECTMTVDASKLNLTGELLIVDEFTDEDMPFKNDGGTLKIPLTLEAQEIRLISISSPLAYRTGKLDRAVRWLESRKSCHEQQRPYGEKLTAWNDKRAWEKEDYFVDHQVSHDGKQSVRIEGKKGEIMQARQLVQKKPYALVISGWGRSEGIQAEEAKSPYGIQVTVHYENLHAMYNTKHVLKFPAGQEWQHREMKIEVDKPVENVQVKPMLTSKTGKGKVWFDDICLKSEADGLKENLLYDPGFEEKFLTAEQSRQLDEMMESLQTSLVELQSSFAAAKQISPQQRTLAGMVRQRMADVRQWIDDHDAAQPAGRELRDLADIERLLKAGDFLGEVTAKVNADRYAFAGQVLPVVINVINRSQTAAGQAALSVSCSDANCQVRQTSALSARDLAPGAEAQASYTVEIPASAQGGSVELTVELKAAAPTGDAIVKTTGATIKVRPTDLQIGKPVVRENQFVVPARVKNNVSVPVRGQVELVLPKPARCSAKPVLALDLPAGEGKDIEFVIPEAAMTSGRYDVQVKVALEGKGTCEQKASLSFGNAALALSGAKVAVDSSAKLYDAVPINDGMSNMKGVGWKEAAWASVKSDEPHWIEIDLPSPKKIHRVIVFWALDKGIVYASRAYQIQYNSGGQWKTLIDIKDNEAAVSDHSFPEVTTDKVRIYQLAKGGYHAKAEWMWVGEVEVY